MDARGASGATSTAVLGAGGAAPDGGSAAAAPSVSRTFGNIYLAGQSSGSGVLKLGANGLSWKAKETTRTLALARSEVSSISWLRATRGWQVRVAIRGGASIRFDGFKDSDYSGLATFFPATLGLPLTRAKQAVRGWSWGEVAINRTSGSLEFRTGNGAEGNAGRVLSSPAAARDATAAAANARMEDAFEVALGSVSNVQMPSKNELALDFHVDDTAARQDECLVEVRFHVSDEARAASLYESIKSRADTSAFAGESICTFLDMPVIVPRGRYDVDLFPNHVKLHGKSVDFKILYSSISRLFLLPKPDGQHVAFVVSLDPPIRQGNTMYPHLVFQFDLEDAIDARLQLSAEELSSKYNGKLAATERGETWRVFSKVVRHLSGTSLHMPKSFLTSRGHRAVRTALGANEGFLFFLDTSFFFVNKPPTYIRFDDVEEIDFRRLDVDRRFDMHVSVSGSGTGAFLFSNIDRSEFDAILRFLDGKGVPIEHVEALRAGNVGGGGAGSGSGVAAAIGAVDDEDDEDESSDEDFDPTAAPKPRHDDDDGGGGDDAAADAMDDDADSLADEALPEEDMRPKKKSKS